MISVPSEGVSKLETENVENTGVFAGFAYS
jgi:hypothetical protein